MRFSLSLTVLAIALTTALILPTSTRAAKLEGRLITFKKTFDGWWDVACDTNSNGADKRCYVQYVDPYSFAPNFRAAMVDFLYRQGTDGRAEPVITFDVEPDLSFERDVGLEIVGNDGRVTVTSVKQCQTGKCVFSGATARAMLVRWSIARTLRLHIKERSGKTVVREWPLGNMREIVRIIADQRKLRGLP